VRIIGQEQIADVLGVAPKTIVEWQEQGMPIAQRGGPGVPSEYISQDCIRWWHEREMRRAQVEGPRDRLARLQADAVEMDNAVKRGTLIPAEQLEPRLRAVFVAFREHLLDLRRVLAPQLVGRTAPDVEQLLEAAHAEALARLARWNQAERDDDEGDDA